MHNSITLILAYLIERIKCMNIDPSQLDDYQMRLKRQLYIQYQVNDYNTYCTIRFNPMPMFIVNAWLQCIHPQDVWDAYDKNIVIFFKQDKVYFKRKIAIPM